MPNKAKSKAQFGFLQAVAHGKAKKKAGGLTPEKAIEMLGHQSPKHLPSRAKKSR